MSASTLYPETANPNPAGFVSQNPSPSENPTPSENPGACENPGPSAPSPQAPPSSPFTDRNRANAAHSTGPRTEEGKAHSAQNACKHGLSITSHRILRYEDPAAYASLRESLHAVYNPLSAPEVLAVEDIAQCRWALRRFDDAEGELLDYHLSPHPNCIPPGEAPMSPGRALGYSCILEHGEPKPLELPSIENLLRYRRYWERRHKEALQALDRAQRVRHQQARDAERREESARKAALAAEKCALAERRREELHQLRLALAQTKLQSAQIKLQNDRDQQARAAAEAARARENTLFEALERYLNHNPEDFDHLDRDLANLATATSPYPDSTPGEEAIFCPPAAPEEPAAVDPNLTLEPTTGLAEPAQSGFVPQNTNPAAANPANHGIPAQDFLANTPLPSANRSVPPPVSPGHASVAPATARE
jgi:hypothetical protein